MPSADEPTPDDAPDRELAEIGPTPRELEVLRHLVAGKTNRRIADDLVISEKTVGHHVSHILGKLDVHTRGEAAAIARRFGITEDRA